jgi:hypothetical protein
VNLKEGLRQTAGSCDCGEHRLDSAESRTVILATDQETGVQE